MQPSVLIGKFNIFEKTNLDNKMIFAFILERYNDIIHPLRTKLTNKQTIVIICGIWISALLISSPVFTLYEVIDGHCLAAHWETTIK